MKNILIFNDFSPEAEHATELALLLAGKTNTNLYVWNAFDKASKPVARELVTANANETITELIDANTSWIEKLESKLNWQTGLMPVVHFINGVDYEPDNVLPVARRFDIGILIKGIAFADNDTFPVETEGLRCSTKSGCPILLIPEKVEYRAFEKIVYATDLRFCRNEVVSFLTGLARSLNASVLIANISEESIPYMEDNYARSVFEKEILSAVKYEHIFFSNIRERDIPKAVDVLVNGMNNDLLVLTNNQYHFNMLLGEDPPYAIPGNVNIPVLIFPS